MIPNIEPRHGRSFIKAGAYYLHDKLTPEAKEKGLPPPTTSQRVAFTHTFNCANDDPELALREMVATFRAQEELKRSAGKVLSGRKCDAPVKTLSLNWQPGETPDRVEMLRAAESFLQHMGWDTHQTLLIAHRDRDHPHLHLVINRVHPETGLTLDSWQERKRSRMWATTYELSQGQIRTRPAFAIDAHATTIGPDLTPSGIPYPYAGLSAEAVRTYASDQDANRDHDGHERGLAALRHTLEREALFASGPQQFRALCNGIYRQVREDYRAVWREHARHARQQRVAADAAHARAEHAAEQLLRAGDPDASLLILEQAAARREEAEKQIADAKALIQAHQRDDTRGRQDLACKALYHQRAYAFKELKTIQAAERAEIRTLQQARDDGRDYDSDRLQHLLRPFDPAAPSPVAHLLPSLQSNEAPSARPDPDRAFVEGPRLGEALDARALHAGQDLAGASPRRDAPMMAAGAIGAFAELTARLFEGIFSPPSPQEQALAKAVARRMAETEPQREELREQQRVADAFMAAAAKSSAAYELREKERRDQWDEWQQGRRRQLER